MSLPIPTDFPTRIDTGGSCQRTERDRRLPVQLRVNGRHHQTDVLPRTTLLDRLRDSIGVTGAKRGSNEGARGTCTVLVDGRRISSCLMLMAQAERCDVTTIESLADDNDVLQPVQLAFIDNNSLQCGYWTPGQVMSAVACTAEGHAGSADKVQEWLSGNPSRCGAYPQITTAILAAARLGSDPYG